MRGMDRIHPHSGTSQHMQKPIANSSSACAEFKKPCIQVPQKAAYPDIGASASSSLATEAQDVVEQSW